MLRPLPVIALLLLAACNGEGDVTVPASDQTPPSLELDVVDPNHQPVTVTGGGAAQSIQLSAKTGKLTTTARAADMDSGVEKVEIWVTVTVTRCTPQCAVQQPLVGNPQFSSSSPHKNPGEKAVGHSVLGDTLDLASIIPQASFTNGNSMSAKIEVWAIAVNQLGGQTTTPTVTATWSEK